MPASMTNFEDEMTSMASRLMKMRPARQWAAGALMQALAQMRESGGGPSAQTGRIQEALTSAFGNTAQPIAELSKRKQEEAVSAWRWFEDVTGHRVCDEHLRRAVSAMRKGGSDWRVEMRDALTRDLAAA